MARQDKIRPFTDGPAAIDPYGKERSVPALEIEEGVLVEMQSIEDDYVYLRKGPSPPVVFLIGCETGAADIEFMNFVAQFRRGGAAIIVARGRRSAAGIRYR